MDLPSRPSVGAGPLWELKGALLLPGAEEQQECEPQGGASRRSLGRAGARALGEAGTCLHVHAFLLPQALFVLYVLLGCWDSCYGADDCAQPRSLFDWSFVALGPVLPLAVLGVRLMVLPFTRNETLMTVIVWVFMATVRLVIYSFWMGPSNCFSDHIFLMACVVGMLQTEIAYAHEFVEKRYIAAAPPLLAAYFLVWRISAEAYVTSSSHHSRIQSCLALLLGVPLFSGIALLWVHLRPPMELEDAFDNGLEAAAAGGGSPVLGDLPPIHLQSNNCAAWRHEGRSDEGRPRAASEYAGGAPRSELPQRAASACVGGTGKFGVHRTPSFGSDHVQAAPPLAPPASAPPHGTLEPPQGVPLESWPAASRGAEAFASAGAVPSPPPADAQPGGLVTEAMVPPSGAGAFGDEAWTPSSAGGANPFADAAESPRDPLAPAHAGPGQLRAALAAAAAAAEAGSAEGLAPAPDPRSCSSGEARGGAPSPDTAAVPEWRDRREQPRRQPACCAFVPGFRRQPRAGEEEEEDDRGQTARGRSADGIWDY